MNLITDILLLLVLVALNAFFAASEIALISLNMNKLLSAAERGDKRAILLKRLVCEPSGFLATIQIGITLAGFFASAFAADNFAEPLAELAIKVGVPLPFSVTETVSMVLVTLLLSYFTLVLGELVPKQIALKKADSIAYFAARPIRALAVLTRPFVALLTGSTNLVVRLFGVDPGAKEQDVTEEEILQMVSAVNENGGIEESQKDMISNIFELTEMTAEEVMTHRTDMVAVSVNAKLTDVIALSTQEGYSRIPVYEDGMDHIIGLVHVKDMFCLVGCENPEDYSVSDFLREVIYVPESGKLMDVFRELTAKKMHMAVVVDEYGGTAGIITMEDIIEEVMGNIQDEYDNESDEITQIADGTYIILGNADPEAVLEELGGALPEDHEYDTIGGLIIDLLGRIPGPGETPTVRYQNIEFTVLLTEDRRMIKIKAVKTEEEE